MSMQPSQRAFEAAKAYAAHIGCSTDVMRHFSQAGLEAAASAPPALQAQAIRAVVKQGASESIAERGQTLAQVSVEPSAAAMVTRPGKGGFDGVWGSVDQVKVDVQTVLREWKERDPRGFSIVERQAAGIAQDLTGLRKLSMATADVMADMAVFGNQRVSPFVAALVSIKLSDQAPTPAVSVPAKPKP